MNQFNTGDKCSWSTLIDGGIVRMSGEITYVPDDTKDFPFDVKGIHPVTGVSYTDKVYLSGLTKIE